MLKSRRELIRSIKKKNARNKKIIDIFINDYIELAINNEELDYLDFMLDEKRPCFDDIIETLKKHEFSY